MSDLYALDTNVLLRFLVGDNKKQQKFAENKFEQGKKGKLKIFVHPLIVAETCFVLESFYELERVNIAEKMQVFLSQRWLKVKDREILLNLWDNYNQGLHFVDSFLNTWAKLNKGKILTFDQKLKKSVS